MLTGSLILENMIRFHRCNQLKEAILKESVHNIESKLNCHNKSKIRSSPPSVFFKGKSENFVKRVTDFDYQGNNLDVSKS